MKPEEFKRLFELAPSKYPHELEKAYPRILNKIVELWDSPEQEEAYMRDLVVDTRGNRQGFPQKVMQEILFVSELYSRWRADRRKMADEKTLKKLGVEMVPTIEAGMRTLTPELIKDLVIVKTAIQKDDSSAVWGMNQKNMNVNQKDKDGQTPLMYAGQSGAEKCMLMLLQAGANPHVTDMTGNTPMHWAVVMGKPKAIEILLYYGSDANAKNKGGATPFSLACIKSDMTMARRLYDYGGDFAMIDNQGNTALHKAVSAKSKEGIAFLMGLGARWDQRNLAGVSPELLAAKEPELKAVAEKVQADARRKTQGRS